MIIKKIYKKWWLLTIVHLPAVFGLCFFFGTFDASLKDDSDLVPTFSVDLPHEHPLNRLPLIEPRFTSIDDGLYLSQKFDKLPEFDKETHELTKQKFALTYIAINLFSSTPPSGPSTALVNLYALKALSEMSDNDIKAAMKTIGRLRNFTYQWQNHSNHEYLWATHGAARYSSQISCALIDQLITKTPSNEALLNQVNQLLATHKYDLASMRRNYVFLSYQFSKSVTHSSQNLQKYYREFGEKLHVSPYNYHPNRTVNACAKIARSHLKDTSTPVSQMIDRIKDHQV